jgi:ATP-dependent Zn protease
LSFVGVPQVKELLSRNRGALDALSAVLLAKEQLQGPEVYEVLQVHLSAGDQQQREQALESMAFM